MIMMLLGTNPAKSLQNAALNLFALAAAVTETAVAAAEARKC